MNDLVQANSTLIQNYTSSPEEIIAHVRLIQDVMQKVMKEGHHYGTIPGCGDKKTLLKPGAEKILETFRLASDMEITDKSDSDSVTYRVKVILTHQITGKFIGAGIGEASSNEEKYKWKGSNDREWNETADDRRRKKWIRKKDGSFFQALQVRTNPADVANTVLKMSKKRGLVDAALTATSASDIFAQDLEDLVDDVEEKPVETKAEQKSSIVSDILAKMVEMHQGDQDEVEKYLKFITTYTSKKGEQKYLKVSDLESVAAKLPEWIERVHKKVCSDYAEAKR